MSEYVLDATPRPGSCAVKDDYWMPDRVKEKWTGSERMRVLSKGGRARWRTWGGEVSPSFGMGLL